MIKILIVDDELGICDILKKTFKPIGFTVLIAQNGVEAISIVKKDKPKLIFLDIKMLGLSGLEVLKEIKKIDKSAKVIMLSVMDDESTINQARDLGADAFISKPFMSEHLEEVAREKIAELIKEEQGDDNC